MPSWFGQEHEIEPSCNCPTLYCPTTLLKIYKHLKLTSVFHTSTGSSIFMFYEFHTPAYPLIVRNNQNTVRLSCAGHLVRTAEIMYIELCSTENSLHRSHQCLTCNKSLRFETVISFYRQQGINININIKTPFECDS
jgi:hypothetical protein